MEESDSYYSKARELVGKLKEVEHMNLSPNLDALVDVDLNLFGIWGSFEKDAMATVERITDGSIKGIRLPSIFGYPEVVYYCNGILVFHTNKTNVTVIVIVVLAKGSKNTKSANR